MIDNSSTAIYPSADHMQVVDNNITKYHMTGVTQCEHDEVRCGLSKQCIPATFVCDYDTDCENAFDEMNCSKLCLLLVVACEEYNC